MPKKKPTPNRIIYAWWLIVPLLLVWLSSNYILGALRRPSWALTTQTVSAPSTQVYETLDVQTQNWRWNGSGLVTLWFDDAWISQYSQAFPILEKYYFKAALSIPTGSVGHEAYMNWSQIKRLQYAGWEISSHSVSHDCTFAEKSKEVIENELLTAKQTLETHGLVSDIYVAPCGVKTDVSTEIIKKYYLAGRNVEPGHNPLPVSDIYNLKIRGVFNNTTLDEIKGWINEAKTNKSWLILMFHQIEDNPPQYGTTPELLRQIVQEISKQKLEVVLPSMVINKAS